MLTGSLRAAGGVGSVRGRVSVLVAGDEGMNSVAYTSNRDIETRDLCSKNCLNRVILSKAHLKFPLLEVFQPLILRKSL